MGRMGLMSRMPLCATRGDSGLRFREGVSAQRWRLGFAKSYDPYGPSFQQPKAQFIDRTTYRLVEYNQN